LVSAVFWSVFWFWNAELLQTGTVCREKSAKRPFLKWRDADHWRLIHDFDRQSVTWLAAIQQAGIFVFHLISPVTLEKTERQKSYLVTMSAQLTPD
jgi:hypothetical protein